MKKTIVIISIIVVIGCVISIGGAYATTSYAINAERIGYTDNSSLGADNVQAAIDGTCTKFSTKLNNMMEQIYPVGSIYITTSISDPKVVASTLGVGKWEAYGKGKTLVGVDADDKDKLFNTVEKTGGNKSNSTKLKVENLPSHSHDITHTHTIGEEKIDGDNLDLTAEKAGAHTHSLTLALMNTVKITEGLYNAVFYVGTNTADIINSAGEHTHKVSGSITIPELTTKTQSTTDSGATGSGTSFETSTLQPYITVYMYKRTE